MDRVRVHFADGIRLVIGVTPLFHGTWNISMITGSLAMPSCCRIHWPLSRA